MKEQKKNEAIVLLQSKIDEVKARRDQLNHAINIRRMTIKEQSIILSGMKDVIKNLNSRGVSTRTAYQMYRQCVEDYNIHTGTIVNLKRMHSQAHEEAYLLELLITKE